MTHGRFGISPRNGTSRRLALHKFRPCEINAAWTNGLRREERQIPVPIIFRSTDTRSADPSGARDARSTAAIKIRERHRDEHDASNFEASSGRLCDHVETFDFARETCDITGFRDRIQIHLHLLFIRKTRSPRFSRSPPLFFFCNSAIFLATR